jgi:PAS domain S-box-containing protein
LRVIFLTFSVLSFLLSNEILNNQLNLLNDIDIFYFLLITLLLLIFIWFIFNILFSFAKFKSIYEDNNKRLKESTEMFSNLLNITMEAVVLSDSKNRIIYFNNSAKKMFGIDKNISNNIQFTIYHFINKKDIPKISQMVKNNSTIPIELNLKKIDKTEFPALISGGDTILDDEKYRISTIIDLSLIKEKERILISNTRLAQMGEMIAMIAHQWKQPLSSIAATNESIFLKAQLGTLNQDTLTASSRKIKEYVKYLSNTIDDFRGFYKEDKKLKLVAVQKVITNTLKIVDNTITSNNISLILSYQTPCILRVYENELQQALLCFISNSIDVLKEKDSDKLEIIISTYLNQQNKELFISIEDNGGGIPDSIIDKIFDPYFSTKKEKNGTGLGLYMAKTILDRINGKIEVKNTKEGAIFTIILPYESGNQNF